MQIQTRHHHMPMAIPHSGSHRAPNTANAAVTIQKSAAQVYMYGIYLSISLVPSHFHDSGEPDADFKIILQG